MLILNIVSSNFKNIYFEQKLLQKLLFFNISNYIEELVLLGFEYSYTIPTVITLENTKGFFYTSPLYRIYELLKLNNSIKEFTLNIFKIDKKSKYNLFLELINYYSKFNSFSSALHIISNTKTKANWNQIMQLIGIRGFLSNSKGDIFKIPVLNSFNKGLKVFEYFISCYGARKGILDTALKTADAGYLTKRLVDLTQEIILKEVDCGNKNSFIFNNNLINIKGEITIPSPLLLYGKLLHSNVQNKLNKQILLLKNNYITENLYFKLNSLTKKYIYNVNINSPKLCFVNRSFCAKCLGLSTHTNNNLGVSFGILAGQTIGEPGTQLTLRTFHTGGILLKNQNYLSINNSYKNYNLYKKNIGSKLCSFVKKIKEKSTYIKLLPLIKIKQNYFYSLGLHKISHIYFNKSKVLNIKSSLYLYKYLIENIYISKLYQRQYNNYYEQYNSINSQLINYTNNIQLIVRNNLNQWIAVNLIPTKLIYSSVLIKNINFYKLILKKSYNQRYIKLNTYLNKTYVFSFKNILSKFNFNKHLYIFKLNYIYSKYYKFKIKIYNHSYNYYYSNITYYNNKFNINNSNKYVNYI